MNQFGYSAGIARNASESAYPNLWRDIVGLYDCATGIRGLRLPDFSGSKNNATINGPTWVSSRSGGALLAASNHCLTPKPIVLTADFTISAKFTLDTYSGVRIWAGYSGDNGQCFLGTLSSATVLSLRTSNAAIPAWTVPTMAVNREYNVTLTRSGTTGRLFVNGIESSSGGQSVVGTFTADCLFGYPNSSYFSMTGKMQSILFYKRAVSTSEILMLARGASPLVPLNRPYFNSPTSPPATNTTNFFRFFR